MQTTQAIDASTESLGRVETKILSFARIGVVAEFELRALWATKSTLFGQAIVEPVVYTAVLAAGLKGIFSGTIPELGNITYMTFVLPGVLGLQVIRGFARSVYRSTLDRRWALLAIKRLSGMGALGYVLGMMAAPVSLFVFQALIMTPLAMWLGAETTLFGWGGAVLLAALCIGFWTGAAIVVTTIVRNYEQRDLIINLSMLPLTFSAPVFYPLNQAPQYLEVAARFNPLSYQVDAMRDAFLGDVNALALLIALALSIGSIAAAAVVVARGEPLGSEQ